MTKRLLAFHNDPKIKEKYFKRVKAHQKADEIVQGIYWENGKGCAVGCTMELSSNVHESMEKELGIPRELAYLEDAMFKELSNEEAKKFPLNFLEAIPVGSDLTKIVGKYVIWQFQDKELGMSQIAEIKEDKELMKICQDVVSLYKRKIKGDNPTKKEWLAVANKADEIYRGLTWTWDGTWTWAGACARAWAGAGACAGAGAWAGARAGATYKEELLIDEEKLLELLREAK